MAQGEARRYRQNGQNKLLPEDRPIHDWYRFVLSFPPHLVREYLARFGLNAQHTVLDPFCGTGTTPVECKKQGIRSIGIEANPVAHFASQVKTDWGVDVESLLGHAQMVAEATDRRLSTEGIDTYSLSHLPLFQLEGPVQTVMRSLPDDKLDLLLNGSISPLPLHKTLVLMDTLNHYAIESLYNHELLALARALVFSISNLEFGPEVGVGLPKQDAPVVQAWLSVVEAIVHDLRVFRHLNGTPSDIILGDARGVLDLLEPTSIDAVITSPPYPNEKDYTRTTRLESVLLGFIQNKHDLRALKQRLVRSNTRSVYVTDSDDRYVAENPEIQALANAIEARRIELGKTSGFERLYARVTKLYFGGMARHLADLRIVLRPGAQLAYVVGDQASYLQVLIRTGQLLADIAITLGYELVSIDLFRTRLATATREQLREEVVVLRWPGFREARV